MVYNALWFHGVVHVHKKGRYHALFLILRNQASPCPATSDTCFSKTCNQQMSRKWYSHWITTKPASERITTATALYFAAFTTLFTWHLSFCVASFTKTTLVWSIQWYRPVILLPSELIHHFQLIWHRTVHGLRISTFSYLPNYAPISILLHQHSGYDIDEFCMVITSSLSSKFRFRLHAASYCKWS